MTERLPRPSQLAAAWAFLAATGLGLAAGLACHLAGAGHLGDLFWIAAGSIALGVTVATSLRDLWRHRFGVDVIAVLALVGTIAVGEYAAAAVIALMVATGRLLETWAAARADNDLRNLLAHAPQVVHRYEDGRLTDPPLGEVGPGDLLLVKPGEVVPVDGRIESDAAVVDLSSLTGESVPATLDRNDEVNSGAVNAGAPFDLRAVATVEGSTFAGIVRLVEQAAADRAPFVRLADRYAVAFVPFTLMVGAIAWALSGSATRAVAVLVVATPCPLILAAPIAIVSGLSRASRAGVIVKGGSALERLAGARVVVLDKTGTVTRGQPVVAQVVAAPGHDSDEVLGLAAAVEQISPHVLASAVVHAAAARGLRAPWPDLAEESVANGVSGVVDGRKVRAGKLDWVGDPSHPGWLRSVRRKQASEGSPAIFVAVDGGLIGALLLEDPLRRDAARSISALRDAGIERIVLATGDREEVAVTVGAVLGVDEVLAERTPGDKVAAVQLERRRGTTVMVGDGVNDAPALAVADVGIALGARGSSASSDAADVVVTEDGIDPVVDAVLIAHRARRIALQSVLAGMGLSVVAMGIAAVGLLPALAGAVVQEVIDVVVILNALRVLIPQQTGTHLTGAAAELGRRLEEEHRSLSAGLSGIRTAADDLDLLEPAAARARLAALDEFLTGSLLPHEQREESEFYPLVAEVIGGHDPTGTMSRAHVEIGHLVGVFHRLVGELGDEGPDREDRQELRRVLYGLDAVLKLHFAQEDERYLSLVARP